MNTKILVVIVALAILIPVGGMVILSDEGGAVSGEFVIVDDRGKVFKFDDNPERIASLGKPFTNILIEIGAADKIVAVDSWSEDFIEDYPDVDLANLSVGGSIFGLDVETVAERTPDLVITYAYSSASVVTRIAAMEALGISVIAFYPQSYGAVIKLVEEMGKVSGNTVEAQAAINDMAGTVIDIQTALANVSDAQKPKVYFELASWGQSTANTGSVSDWLITMAGGINVAQNASESSTYKPETETVMAWDVEIIVVEEKHPWTDAKLRTTYDNPDSDEPDVYRLSHGYNTYDLNLVNGLKQMAEYLHPELFDFS